MVASATAALCAFLFAWGFARYLDETSPARGGRLRTFIVDPPTFFVVGLVSALVGLATRKGRKLAREQFLKRRDRIGARLWIFMIGFWAFELLTYFDVLAPPAWDHARSGNDFMWNGYVHRLTGPIFHWGTATYHHWWSWPFLAAMLLVQYGALRFGRALGYVIARFCDHDRRSSPRR